MKRLFEVRVGGGRVHSGLLPIEILGLIQDLMAAMEEEGGDRDVWARANPHVEIVGKDSTKSAVLTEEYSDLVGPAQLFTLKARERNLGPKGRHFVERHFRPGQPWAYAEVTVCNDNRPAIRFNGEYRDAVKEERRAISGRDQFFARVVRVGGEKPTAKLEIGQRSGTFEVASQSLAKKLGERLFETVKIDAEVIWDSKSLELLSLKVTGLDESWQDVHLAEVIEKHGGRLPLVLSVESTEELLSERAKAREQL